MDRRMNTGLAAAALLVLSVFMITISGTLWARANEYCLLYVESWLTFAGLLLLAAAIFGLLYVINNYSQGFTWYLGANIILVLVFLWLLIVFWTVPGTSHASGWWKKSAPLTVCILLAFLVVGVQIYFYWRGIPGQQQPLVLRPSAPLLPPSPLMQPQPSAPPSLPPQPQPQPSSPPLQLPLPPQPQPQPDDDFGREVVIEMDPESVVYRTL